MYVTCTRFNPLENKYINDDDDVENGNKKEVTFIFRFPFLVIMLHISFFTLLTLNNISLPSLFILFIAIKSLQSKSSTLPGDILLISSFLSYAGCFTRRYREELQQKMWMSNFRKIEVSSFFIFHT